MSITKIDLPDRDWKEFSIQGMEGKIVKHHGKFLVDVPVYELPGESVTYPYECPFELNDSLINRLVIGDIGRGGFNIRILCIYEFAKEVD